MRIAQITDTHLQGAGTEDPRGIARAENLRRCVADLNRLTPSVDAVIHTGDITEDGGAEAFAHARLLLSEIAAPFFIIPGNRDDRAMLRATFEDHAYLPRADWHLSYVVDDLPVRLVVLDTIDAGVPAGLVCEERLEWLDAALANGKAGPTVLFMHHPPFEVADHPRAFRERENADRLAEVVARHDQVARVICGHYHRPGQVAWGGTVGSVTACVAGDLRKGPPLRGPDAREVNGAPVYEIHTVEKNGRSDSILRVIGD